MSLLSLGFLVFVLITFTLYYALPKYQTIILLLANVVFLASWSWQSLVILAVLSNLVFFSLKRVDFRPGKLLTLALTLVPGFVLLGFKLRQAQTPVQVDSMTNLIIPLGLSYYVFQLAGYVIDCYRREVREPFTWLRFANFSSFFPQLMIGPIEKYSTMHDQFHNGVELDFDRFIRGLFRISLGVLKKLTVADPLFPVFRLAFESPSSWNASQILFFCVVGFFQIYFDFSSYADIAVGLGRLFGIRLTENFRQPYLATSVSDIWQRWHFSLVRWVRSYVFFPLYLKTRSIALCTLMTFIAVGLWHQLAVNLLLWAVYWFALFYIGSLIRELWPNWKASLWGSRARSIFAMSLASVFFVEGGPKEIGQTLFRLFDLSGLSKSPALPTFGLSHLDVMGLGLCMAIALASEFLEFHDRLERYRNTRVFLACTVLTAFFATLFAKDLPRPFIYLMF